MNLQVAPKLLALGPLTCGGVGLALYHHSLWVLGKPRMRKSVELSEPEALR